MAIDLEAIRKKLNQLSGVSSKRRAMWRPEEGQEYSVRIIAFPNNNGNPFQERWFYYNIGNNPGLLTPNQFGKPDPFQELIGKLRAEGSKESYEMAKKLYPKMRTYAAVIVRGEENEGVRLWSFGKGVYKNLLDIMLDPDYGDITDIKTGHDIKVNCTKNPGQQWATTDIRPRPKSIPLGTADQIKQWTSESSFPNLDDMYSLKSYEELEGIINAWLNGDEDQGSAMENTVVRTAPKPQPKSKSKSEDESFDDLDDAFADLEDDNLPF